MSTSASWGDVKGRRLCYTTKLDGRRFEGTVVQKGAEGSFLVDWDDGSTSKVYAAVKGASLAAALKHYAAALAPIPVTVRISWKDNDNVEGNSDVDDADDDPYNDAAAADSGDAVALTSGDVSAAALATPAKRRASSPLSSKTLPRATVAKVSRSLDKSPPQWAPGAAVFFVQLQLQRAVSLRPSQRDEDAKQCAAMREAVAKHIYDHVIVDKILGNESAARSARPLGGGGSGVGGLHRKGEKARKGFRPRSRSGAGGVKDGEASSSTSSASSASSASFSSSSSSSSPPPLRSPSPHRQSSPSAHRPPTAAASAAV